MSEQIEAHKYDPALTLLRCNFYFYLCHKLAVWPWASHQISLTHANLSDKGYCKASISADDYYMHISSSSFSSLFSSPALSLSFQIWRRKLNGNIQNRYSFCWKIATIVAMLPTFCQTSVTFQVAVNRQHSTAMISGGTTCICWGCSSLRSLQYQATQNKDETN